MTEVHGPAGKGKPTNHSVKQSLFDTSQKHEKPLAERMRPGTFDEVLGQMHVTAQESLFRKSVLEDRLSSIVLYGPPGTGKTTLARLVAYYTKKQFKELNAVFSTVQNLRDIIKEAQDALRYYDKGTIIFVDEIHRWNKAQQEALLPWIEDGSITLIGATTQNPFFELSQALLSRVQVFELFRLEEEHLITALHRALTDTARGYGNLGLTIEPDAAEFLVRHTGGDVRIVYNVLEWLVETHKLKQTAITEDMIKAALQKKSILYDRDGDYHYDTASAFIKSIRGSDPDAALFWASVMLEGGEDPKFLLRRLLIASAEDIGLAEPGAIQVVTSCAEAFDRVGMPEGWYFIAEAVLYCATCPKSNSAGAIFAARELARTRDFSVPLELKDASKDGKALGHGAGYRYPHDYSGHWIPHSYMPAGLINTFIYKPSRSGFENSRFTETMLRHTSIILSDDVQLAVTDVHAVTEAYITLVRAMLAQVQSFENMLIAQNQGLVFARIASIVTPTKRQLTLALPETSAELVVTRYFSDFEPALFPKIFTLPCEAIDAGIVVSGEGAQAAQSLLEFTSACCTRELVVYGHSKHKTDPEKTEKLLALLSSFFTKIVYIEPLVFQRGLLPELLKQRLPANAYMELQRYDIEYFANKEAAYQFAHNAVFDSCTVQTIETYAPRRLTHAFLKHIGNRDNEYYRELPPNIGLENLLFALTQVETETIVQWRYAWDMYILTKTHTAPGLVPNRDNDSV